MENVAFDIETYPNYCLFAFKSESGRVWAFEAHEWGFSAEEIAEMKRLFLKNKIFTWNGAHFDFPLTKAVFTGASPANIHAQAERIIKAKSRGRGFYPFKHCYDLMLYMGALAPSLKKLEIRLGLNRLESLPVAPGTILNLEQKEQVKDYCLNADLPATLALISYFEGDVAAREVLSESFETDLKRRSDAQIMAEIVISKFGRAYYSRSDETQSFSLPLLSHNWLKTPYKNGKAAEFAAFLSQCRIEGRGREELNFKAPDGGLKAAGSSKGFMPIEIAGRKYAVGLGGLHAAHRGQVFDRARAEMAGKSVIDIDVASYYPALVINNHLEPPAYKGKFIELYSSLVERRLKIKHSRDRKEQQENRGLKIAINGTFGQFLNPYSDLYAPQNGYSITTGGQLLSIDLIERCANAALNVVSANTDGITLCIDESDRQKLKTICRKWEQDYNLVLEETDYSVLAMLDVNNYFALTSEGKLKKKGRFIQGDVYHDPKAEIITEAVIEYYCSGTPLADTVSSETDMKKFILSASSKDGIVDKAGNNYGKVIRWFYPKTGGMDLFKGKANNKGTLPKLPKAQNCRPAFVLSDFSVETVAKQYYIDEAAEFVRQIEGG